MSEELPLPCVECCLLDMTCCHNPQILWNLEEVDNLLTVHHGSDILKGLVFLKGDAPGTIYILRVPKDGIDKKTNSVRLDYCALYDQDNRQCSVYAERPSICRTYGDPKYNTCPYSDYREPGAITELIKKDINFANKLHTLAPSNPEAYLNDYILPFIKRFQESEKDHPEYKKYWDSLPEPNFVRK